MYIHCIKIYFPHPEYEESVKILVSDMLPDAVFSEHKTIYGQADICIASFNDPLLVKYANSILSVFEKASCHCFYKFKNFDNVGGIFRDFKNLFRKIDNEAGPASSLYCLLKSIIRTVKDKKDKYVSLTDTNSDYNPSHAAFDDLWHSQDFAHVRAVHEHDVWFTELFGKLRKITNPNWMDNVDELEKRIEYEESTTDNTCIKTSELEEDAYGYLQERHGICSYMVGYVYQNVVAHVRNKLTSSEELFINPESIVLVESGRFPELEILVECMLSKRIDTSSIAQRYSEGESVESIIKSIPSKDKETASKEFLLSRRRKTSFLAFRDGHDVESKRVSELFYEFLEYLSLHAPDYVNIFNYKNFSRTLTEAGFKIERRTHGMYIV